MRYKYNKSRDRFIRVTFGFIALFLIFLGAFYMVTGKLFYQNYWGGSVFAPVTVLVGTVLLFAVIFRWGQFRDVELYNNNRLQETEDENDWAKKHKHRGHLNVQDFKKGCGFITHGTSFHVLCDYLATQPGVTFTDRRQFFSSAAEIRGEFLFRGHTFKIVPGDVDDSLFVSPKDAGVELPEIAELRDHVARFKS
jgi:uncharacterized membrane protein